MTLLSSLRRLFAAPEQKRSAAGPLIALHQTGRPQWTPRNYAALAKEAFAGNPVGYRCVRMIAEAAAAVPWLLFEGDQELDRHPLLDLLAKPNPAQPGRVLMESFYGHLETAGNVYLEAVRLGNDIRELHVLRPDRMRAVPGRDGRSEAYEYSVNGASLRFRQDGDPRRQAAPLGHSSNIVREDVPMLRKRTDFIVLHCSATRACQDIGASDIRRWHVAKGWKDIGYHFVIRLDGRIEKGRAISSIGSHVAGHNANSVGVCLVGGLDDITWQPADTFTSRQWSALKGLLIQLFTNYPQARLLGHRDFPGVAKACPCFDVRPWARRNGFPAAN